jgi:8-hydroxy-5-deazaflavin:NADPH oxidoreductase
MKIGVLGSGAVGQVLATGFLKEGHEVLLGTRNIAKPEIVKWKNENPKGKTGSFEAAAKFGELLVLATKGNISGDVIKQAGTQNFAGKTVIDTTNPIADAAPENGVLKFYTNLDSSLLEAIQQQIPDAKIVKAFNSVGNLLMYKPNFTGSKPTMFICGNDDGAKKTVTDILFAFGWETEDMGKAEAARAIEPLCMLWCIPGFLHNQWTHAFKLLKL